MTRVSMSLVFAIAACGGSQHPASGPEPTGPQPATPTAATPATPAAPAGASWVEDASLCANHPDELGPWNLSKEQMSKRYGTGVVALASITTSKAHPIELCGVMAENVWLASSLCADGSHPYPSPAQVEASRAGNVGAGGRCQGIIDLYRATCPEKTYDVYIDMNLCGPGESFM